MAGRGCGDMHTRMHQRALQALQEAGLPPAQARAVRPASALPRRWEKLGDVVLAEAVAEPHAWYKATSMTLSALRTAFPDSIVASIRRCHRRDRGSIPRQEACCFFQKD